MTRQEEAEYWARMLNLQQAMHRATYLQWRAMVPPAGAGLEAAIAGRLGGDPGCHPPLADYRMDRIAREAAAAERSLALLWRFLSRQQRQDLRTNRYFDVLTPRAPWRLWAIRHDTVARNAQSLINDGGMYLFYDFYAFTVDEYGYAYAGAVVPLGDQLLAQKTMLEHDEAWVRRNACYDRGTADRIQILLRVPCPFADALAALPSDDGPQV